jgi:GNAT superfamily N-acetyltransferase
VDVVPKVGRLGQADLDGIVEVLADAFGSYPVMRHVLSDGGDYAGNLDVLLRFFATARILRGEPVLGASLEGTLVGVALVSFPEVESPPALAALRTDVWEALGDAARDRYERFGQTTAAFFQGLSRTHLNMIGVRGRTQGRGVGRVLLESVAELALARNETAGVTLTTEVRSNVDLYEKFGYEVIGHVQVSPDLESWGMLKRSKT